MVFGTLDNRRDSAAEEFSAAGAIVIAHARTTEQAEAIATRLEKVAEEAIAFVTEDASARAEHLRAVLGDDSTELDLDVNTFAVLE